MDLPVCLIKNTADGKLQVNAKATEILSEITQPVVVVAIVGPYRTGKSYLMNKLAGTQKGFDLGSSVEAQTKGIWMRCLPHPTKEGHTLVLLDTEGLGIVEEEDKKNEMQIFCLAVLLSSALVYNSKTIIDENAIEKLHYVGKIAELIKVKSKDNDEDEAEYSRHFPLFIWTVRDVTLKLELNGKPITEDDYLENVLMLKKAENVQKNLEKVKKHNKYRECIRMYFRTRKCFMFDLPSGDKDVLQNLDEVFKDQLNHEFMEQTKKFCDYVYNNVEVKYMDNMYKVTGKTFAQLATMYTEAISSSKTACIEEVVAKLSVVENTIAVKEATQHYESKMEERVTLPIETLEIIELSKECEKEAQQKFLKRSFKDNDRQFHKQYLENISQKEGEFLKKNDMESHIYWEKLMKTLSEDLEKSLKKNVYSTPGGFRRFQEEMECIEEKYKNEARKSTKADDVLKDFRKSKEMTGMTILRNDKSLSYWEKKREEQKANEKKQELEKKIKERKQSEEKTKMEHQKRTVEENLRESIEKEKKERELLQEQLKAVLEAKERERDLYISQGYPGHAQTFQTQFIQLSNIQQELSSTNWMVLAGIALGTTALFFFTAPVVAAGIFFAGVMQLFKK